MSPTRSAQWCHIVRGSWRTVRGRWRMAFTLLTYIAPQRLPRAQLSRLKLVQRGIARLEDTPVAGYRPSSLLQLRITLRLPIAGALACTSCPRACDRGYSNRAIRRALRASTLLLAQHATVPCRHARCDSTRLVRFFLNHSLLYCSGASNTEVVIVDGSGAVVARAHGGPSNGWVRRAAGIVVICCNGACARAKQLHLTLPLLLIALILLPLAVHTCMFVQLMGAPAVADLLVDLFHQAKDAAHIARDAPLESIVRAPFMHFGAMSAFRPLQGAFLAHTACLVYMLADALSSELSSTLSMTPMQGACMSGFLQPRQQEALTAALRERDASLARSYYIDNDSPGSVYTAAGPAGGCVIISGTGTMSQLIDSNGKAFNCGGWGHMFGDGACSVGRMRAVASHSRLVSVV